MRNQQAGDSPMSRAACVSAFQLYDLVTATNGEITYEEAQEELGLTDEEMAEAFHILKEAMELRQAHRRRSGISGIHADLIRLGDGLRSVLTSV